MLFLLLTSRGSGGRSNHSARLILFTVQLFGGIVPSQSNIAPTLIAGLVTHSTLALRSDAVACEKPSFIGWRCIITWAAREFLILESICNGFLPLFECPRSLRHLANYPRYHKSQNGVCVSFVSCKTSSPLARAPASLHLIQLFLLGVTKPDVVALAAGDELPVEEARGARHQWQEFASC